MSLEFEVVSKSERGRRSSLSMMAQTTSAKSFDRGQQQARRSSLSMVAPATNRSRSAERCPSRPSYSSSMNSDGFGELSLSDVASTNSSSSFSSREILVADVFDPFLTATSDDLDGSLGDFAFGPETLDDTKFNDFASVNCHHASFSSKQPLAERPVLVKMNQSMSALQSKFYSPSLLTTPHFNNSGNLYSSQRWAEGNNDDDDDDDNSHDSFPPPRGRDKQHQTEAKDQQPDKKKRVKKKTLPTRKDISGAEFARITKKRQSRQKEKTSIRSRTDHDDDEEETGTVDTFPLTTDSGHSGSVCSSSTTPSQISRQSAAAATATTGTTRPYKHKRRQGKSGSEGAVVSDEETINSCCSSHSSFSSAMEDIKPDNRLSKIVLRHMKKMQEQRALDA